MYVNKDRRLGFVKFSFSMLAMELETIRAIFVEMQFVPLHIETKLHEDLVEYYGTSPKFRPVLEGEKIPLYIINIKRSNEKLLYTFEFEEVRS
jgi:hypothetical protein